MGDTVRLSRLSDVTAEGLIARDAGGTPAAPFTDLQRTAARATMAPHAPPPGSLWWTAIATRRFAVGRTIAWTTRRVRKPVEGWGERWHDGRATGPLRPVICVG
jgi:hypothetical protein